MLVRFGAASTRLSECDGVTPSAHRRNSRFETGDGSLTRFGCPSLKTKTLDCTRRPEHAAQHRCTRGESSGQRQGARHEHQDLLEAHPITRPWRVENQGFRYGESRRGVQSLRFAKPKPLLGLRPQETRRATYANLRYLETFKSRDTTAAHGTCRSKLLQ